MSFIIDPLSLVYNQGPWKLNKVSALYNLQYSEVKLKQYTSKIKQAVASNVVGNSAINYIVKVEANPNLKYLEDDADALLITVYTTPSEKTINVTPKVAYAAILLSWGVFNTVPDAVHLPYMLEKGEQKVGTVVKTTLMTVFDCKIKQYCFNQQHLLLFGLSFVENENSSLEKNVCFSYTTPNNVVKDKLNIQFEMVDVFMIMTSVKKDVTKKSDLVNQTYQILQNQIFHMFVMDITVLDLCEITLPKASVKSNGVVKMKTPEMVNCAFTILNEINGIDSV